MRFRHLSGSRSAHAPKSIAAVPGPVPGFFVPALACGVMIDDDDEEMGTSEAEEGLYPGGKGRDAAEDRCCCCCCGRAAIGAGEKVAAFPAAAAAGTRFHWIGCAGGRGTACCGG
jgi:hypothetical protein